jgi:hypothetical protein
MFPHSLNDRFEMLIDELIEHGGLYSTSLASILTAVQDSMDQGYCLELSRRVWMVSNELRPEDAPDPGAAVLTSLDGLRTNRQAV